MYRIVFGVLFGSLVLAGASGCAATDEQLAPARMPPRQTTSIFEPDGAHAAMMEAIPSQWAGSLATLGNRVRPIAVTLRNHTNTPVRVSYADFAFFDAQGGRFAVLRPFATCPGQEGATMAAGTPTAGATAPTLTPAMAAEPAAPRSATEQITLPLRAPEHTFPAPRGFVVSVRDEGYLGTRAAPAAALANPPAYSALVLGWPGVQAGAGAPAAVQRTALREGVLEPGGTVSGFLYLQNPDRQVDRARLTWYVHAVNGRDLWTVEIPFKAVTP